MNMVTIKRISTDEELISDRTVGYQIWVNDEYLITSTDVNDAMDFKAKLEQQPHDWVRVR